MNTIEAYYDEHAQLEWQRFDRHPIEFAITKRALAQYLPPPPGRILDCGGGPGRYAIHLTQLGYQVSLLDLSQQNLALAQRQARAAGVEIASLIHGNALDLTQFQADQFDAVLLLGPLYHLVSPAERGQAVAQALRVLRLGGPFLAGFITLYAPFRDAISKGYLEDFSSNPAMTEDLLTSQTAKAGFTDAWFTPPGEICPWLESFGLRTQALLAVEGLAAGHEQHLNALAPAAFEYWADLNYRFCGDPCLYGAADHLLYVGALPD